MAIQKKKEKLKSTLLFLFTSLSTVSFAFRLNIIFQCPDLTLYLLYFWVPKLDLIFFSFSFIHFHLSVTCFSPSIHLHSKYLLIFTFLNLSLTKIVSVFEKQSHFYFFNEFNLLTLLIILKMVMSIKIHFPNSSLYLRTWDERRCADVLHTCIIPHTFQYIDIGSLHLVDINLRS